MRGLGQAICPVNSSLVVHKDYRNRVFGPTIVALGIKRACEILKTNNGIIGQDIDSGKSLQNIFEYMGFTHQYPFGHGGTGVTLGKLNTAEIFRYLPIQNQDRYRQALEGNEDKDIFFVPDGSPGIDLKRAIRHDMRNIYTQLYFMLELEGRYSKEFNEAKKALFSIINKLGDSIDSDKEGIEWEEAFRKTFAEFKNTITDDFVSVLCQELDYKRSNELRITIDYLRLFYKSFIGQDITKNVDLERIFEIIRYTEVNSHFYTLHFDCEEESRYIFAREGEIFRAFLNLIRNAVEAMERDRNKISIDDRTARRGFKGTIDIKAFLQDNHVVVKISDTGPGMPQEALEAFKNKTSFSSKELGGGRGLRTVRAIIERNNGTINVESEPGKGTTLTISLPLAPGKSSLASMETAGGMEGLKRRAVEIEKDLMSGFPESGSVDEKEARGILLKLASHVLTPYGYSVFRKVNHFYEQMKDESFRERLIMDSNQIATDYLANASFISAVLPAGQFYVDMYDPVSRRFLAFMQLVRGEINEETFLRRDLPDYDFLHVFEMPEGRQWELTRNNGHEEDMFFLEMTHSPEWKAMEARLKGDFRSRANPVLSIKYTDLIEERKRVIREFMRRDAIALCLSNAIPLGLWNNLNLLVEPDDYQFLYCIRDLLIGMDKPLYVKDSVNSGIPQEFQINFLLNTIKHSGNQDVKTMLKLVFDTVFKAIPDPGRPRHDASRGLIDFSRRHWNKTFEILEASGLIRKNQDNMFEITPSGESRLQDVLMQREKFLQKGKIESGIKQALQEDGLPKFASIEASGSDLGSLLKPYLKRPSRGKVINGAKGFPKDFLSHSYGSQTCTQDKSAKLKRDCDINWAVSSAPKKETIVVLCAGRIDYKALEGIKGIRRIILADLNKESLEKAWYGMPEDLKSSTYLLLLNINWMRPRAIEKIKDAIESSPTFEKAIEETVNLLENDEEVWLFDPQYVFPEGYADVVIMEKAYDQISEVMCSYIMGLIKAKFDKYGINDRDYFLDMGNIIQRKVSARVISGILRMANPEGGMIYIDAHESFPLRGKFEPLVNIIEDDDPIHYLAKYSYDMSRFSPHHRWIDNEMPYFGHAYGHRVFCSIKGSGPYALSNGLREGGIAAGNIKITGTVFGRVERQDNYPFTHSLITSDGKRISGENLGRYLRSLDNWLSRKKHLDAVFDALIGICDALRELHKKGISLMRFEEDSIFFANNTENSPILVVNSGYLSFNPDNKAEREEALWQDISRIVYFIRDSFKFRELGGSGDYYEMVNYQGEIDGSKELKLALDEFILDGVMRSRFYYASIDEFGEALIDFKIKWLRQKSLKEILEEMDKENQALTSGSAL
ncbi:MAG: ATP-binding protein [Candidatus Omnitrophota bacterium]|nr:ATP-binding protein [Candidatus Omnitrophota bacterium]